MESLGLPSIRIGDFLLDGTAPPFVIAEAGVNHNGSVAKAHELVDIAARSGAQAVKFQIFSASRVAHAYAPAAEYQRRNSGDLTQQQLLRSLELPNAAWRELCDHARHLGIAFLATAFDRESLELLLELEPSAIKIGSGDFTNLRCIRESAATGLPIIASTGLCTAGEVTRTVRLLRALESDFALLHCVTSYPAPLEEANLKVIPMLRETERVVVGWSDHTIGTQAAVLARALGAEIFERHFTSDRDLPGPDHRASSDPKELREYVAILNQVDRAMGNGLKAPTEAEIPLRPLVRRSHFAVRDLKPGVVLCDEDTELLRPQTGIDAFESLSGRRVLREIRAGEPVMAESLDLHS